MAPPKQPSGEAQRALARERARVAAAERERRDHHQQAQLARAEKRTQELQARVAQLQAILRHGLTRRPALDFAASHAGPPLDLSHLPPLPPAPDWCEYAPTAPVGLAQLFGGAARCRRRKQQAQERYAVDLAAHQQAEILRAREVRAARDVHDRDLVPQRAHLAELRAAWQKQDKGAMEEYLQRALTGMILPTAFPHEFNVAYDSRTGGALVKFQLLDRDVIPGDRGYSYVKSRDELRIQPRPNAEMAQLYRIVIAQVALLGLRDLLVADPRLTNAAFNGHLHAVDPRTGNDVNPCLIGVAVDRARFVELSLDRVSPDACLRHLNALVSTPL